MTRGAPSKAAVDDIRWMHKGGKYENAPEIGLLLDYIDVHHVESLPDEEPDLKAIIRRLESAQSDIEYALSDAIGELDALAKEKTE